MVAGADSGENLLVSPLSISTALAMTYSGVRGNTATQIADVLHWTLPDERLHAAIGGLQADLNTPREGYELSVVNRLFGQSGYPFKQPFLDTVRDAYAVPLEELNFAGAPNASRLHINDWVADQTHDRIQDLLPDGSVTSDTRLVLTNAVHFNGAWKYKFDESATHDAPFHLADGGETPASLMFQKESFRYGDFDGYQMLEMPYAGDDLSMVVVLPREVDGLAALEGSLTADELTTSLDARAAQETLVYLPKFTFGDTVGLTDLLQGLGMTDAFSPGVVDLTGIADAELSISGVFHKTFIDVNEEGTEAAAATAVVIELTSALYPFTPPPVFRRPPVPVRAARHAQRQPDVPRPGGGNRKRGQLHARRAGRSGTGRWIAIGVGHRVAPRRSDSPLNVAQSRQHPGSGSDSASYAAGVTQRIAGDVLFNPDGVTVCFLLANPGSAGGPATLG